MGQQISDGAGKGFSLQIDAENRGRVLSDVRTEEHHIAEKDQEVFFLHTGDTADTLTVTATGGTIIFVQNDSSTKRLVISEIIIGSDVAGTVIRLVKNYTVGVIADNNALTPFNSFLGAADTADLTAHSWDEVNNGVGGLTAGTLIGVLLSSAGNNEPELRQAIVLDRKDNFGIELKSVSTTDECNITLVCFFDAE